MVESQSVWYDIPATTTYTFLFTHSFGRKVTVTTSVIKAQATPNLSTLITSNNVNNFYVDVGNYWGTEAATGTLYVDYW